MLVLQTTNGAFYGSAVKREISVLKENSERCPWYPLSKNEELETVYLIGENPIINSDYKRNQKEVHFKQVETIEKERWKKTSSPFEPKLRQTKIKEAMSRYINTNVRKPIWLHFSRLCYSIRKDSPDTGAKTATLAA